MLVLIKKFFKTNFVQSPQTKTIYFIAVVIIAFLIGRFTVKDSSKTLSAIPQQNISVTTAPEAPEFVKHYKNEKYGYELQYPAFFHVDATRPDVVMFTNSTCATNDKLCLPGVDSVQIAVSNAPHETLITQTYKVLAKTNSTCKLIKIAALPENTNRNELIEAVRCAIKEVPKPSPGGYSYTIHQGVDKIITVTILQSDSVVFGYMDDSLVPIAFATYDQLGDTMMRTFKFSK